jgi:hypothetical protein
MIEILLFQICEEGEKGRVSQLVQGHALKLFNFMVENQLIAIDDFNNFDVEGQYLGNMSQEATFYGGKLFDSSCQLNKLMMKKISASDGKEPISLDRLTLKKQEYITTNVFDSNPNVVTFSNGLCTLKEHFCSIISNLEKEFSDGCFNY